MQLTQARFADVLGLSPGYVAKLEAGAEPSNAVRTLVLLQEANLDLEASSKEENGAIISPFSGKLAESAGGYRADKTGVRQIPILGWAHAGDHVDYEEIAGDEAERILTDCPDSESFAVKLEGRSMEPTFSEGDVLVLMPGQRVYSGMLVVARFAGTGGGVLFRRVERDGEKMHLVPDNEAYPTTTHVPEDFCWMYPVWGRWTQTFRGKVASR